MAMNNSLAEVHPELVSEWSEKNKIKPTEVSIGSHMKCFSAAETEDTILLCVTAGALRIIVYIEANVTMRSRMRESRTYGSVRG